MDPVEQKPEPPKPNAENLAKAAIVAKTINQWVKWREGDWVFSLSASQPEPMAFHNPISPSSFDGYYGERVKPSALTPIEFFLLEKLNILQGQFDLVAHREWEKEKAVLNDIMEGGDGNLPQNNEEAVACILGDSAQYQHVKKLAALLDAARQPTTVHELAKETR